MYKNVQISNDQFSEFWQLYIPMKPLSKIRYRIFPLPWRAPSLFLAVNTVPSTQRNNLLLSPLVSWHVLALPSFLPSFLPPSLLSFLPSLSSIYLCIYLSIICAWLRYSMTFIHITECISTLFLLLLNNVPLYHYAAGCLTISLYWAFELLSA